MKAFITGDTHGDMTRFRDIQECQSPMNMIIITGDAAFNFFGGKRDARVKDEAAKYPCYWYVYCGNHDMRPQDVAGMEQVYDERVKGWVYWEPKYPNIRYFFDYGVYTIDGYKCAVIGHGYSVDKFYRLARHWTWHPDEQLNTQERYECLKLLQGQSFDFVLSHVAPYTSQPFDAFLPSIDQSTVDNTMEYWLEDVRDVIDYKVWIAGHYHIDRIQEPKLEIFYRNFDSLDNIFQRWNPKI